MLQWNKDKSSRAAAGRVVGPGALTAAALVLGLALAGCAPMPPAQEALQQRDLADAQVTASIRLARDGWPDAQWWNTYGDPQLNALMTQALQLQGAAPTLQVAAARIGAAHAALQLQRAAQGLNVDFKASANRQRYSATGLFPAPIGGSIYNEATLQLGGTYDFDWWGRHRAQVAAAMGEVYARQADLAQAERSLSAEVAQSYFALQADWALQANLRQLRDTRRALLDDGKRRIAQGVAAISVQRHAEAALAQTEQQLADIEAQAGREREALRALLGAGNRALADLKPRPLPDSAAALPASLGIELLARRPDLQAARWRVQASLSRIDAAQAAFYPSVNLTALFGQDSLSLGDLMQAGSRTFFIGPALSLPIFDSGRLQAQLSSQRNARDAAIAEYNQAIVDAVREVAQEGVSLQGLERERARQAEAQQADRALLDGAQRRLRAGLADRSAVLDAQARATEEQARSLQLQGRQLNTEVALIRALGGGYRHAPESAPMAAPADTAPATTAAPAGATAWAGTAASAPTAVQ
ncbi:MAG TPA: efflux transporter outer membrane subunit [Herbaspirillum sp.]